MKKIPKDGFSRMYKAILTKWDEETFKDLDHLALRYADGNRSLMLRHLVREEMKREIRRL